MRGLRRPGRIDRAPVASSRHIDTLVLETELETAAASVRLDRLHAAARATSPDIVRIVEGVRGRVRMRMELVIRFDYGSIVPWVRSVGRRRSSRSPGPDALVLRTPVEHAAART